MSLRTRSRQLTKVYHCESYVISLFSFFPTRWFVCYGVDIQEVYSLPKNIPSSGGINYFWKSLIHKLITLRHNISSIIQNIKKSNTESSVHYSVSDASQLQHQSSSSGGIRNIPFKCFMVFSPLMNKTSLWIYYVASFSSEILQSSINTLVWLRVNSFYLLKTE